MATPTISRVNPPLGVAGGKTLVEIEGSGFKLPPEPILTAPNPTPGPTVRVRIGGRRASAVLVYEDGYLTCLTPEGDPFDVSFAFTASAATDVFSAAGHTLKEGDRLRFAGASLPPPVLPAVPALPNEAQQATTLYAVNVVAGVSFQASGTPSGGAIDLTANGSGTVTSEGYADVQVTNLDEGGTPIAGESVTLARAFSYRRPDLTRDEGSLAAVVRALIRFLQRVHENVVFTTHTDYDDQRGDALDFAAVERLPALVLTALDLPEDRRRPANEQDVVIHADRALVRRPAVICDLTAVLVGVSDDTIEFFNMMEAVRLQFQKTPLLRVPRGRDPNDLDDVIEYDMRWAFGSAQVTVGTGGELKTNAKSFAGTITIAGIRLEATPGAPLATVDGAPSGYEPEATQAFGFTAEQLRVTAVKKT